MSLAAILLLVAAPAPSPAAESEIVVLGRKLQMLEVDVRARKRGGKLEIYRCRLTRGSGDPEVDAIPCDTAHQCLAGASPPTTRKALGTCIEALSNERLDGIAAQRRAARGDEL